MKNATQQTTTPYQPKTGQPCGCKPGQQRDNCPACEGTGMRIDFAAIRAKAQKPDRLAELKARHEKEIQEMEAKETILSLLPECLPLPTVSNITSEGAWLSWSAPYGQNEREFALGVPQALESSGAKPVPLSLVKWDNYRRCVEAGLTDEIPEEQGRKKLTDVEPIAPLWIVPCQFTGVAAECCYEIAGKRYWVSVKAPLAARLSCRKVENIGGWRFDGTCTVIFPDKWHAIYSGSECVAHVSQHTRGYRDTEQGISGTVYFQPLTEQEAFPLSPAQMLAQLL